MLGSRSGHWGAIPMKGAADNGMESAGAELRTAKATLKNPMPPVFFTFDACKRHDALGEIAVRKQKCRLAEIGDDQDITRHANARLDQT